jgi:hypothetical protein
MNYGEAFYWSGEAQESACSFYVDCVIDTGIQLNAFLATANSDA